MPFTFAHPAIILPFRKKLRNLSLTALIIGSMAPDFEYFVRLKPLSMISHSLVGILVFDVPMVFLVAYIFHRIVKGPFIVHLPRPFSYWLQDIALQRWQLNSIRQLIIFVMSSIIGICTHIFWDAFTHSTGFFVMKIPFLQGHIRILSYEIPIYKLLQHGSTLIGLLIIAIYLVMNRSRINERDFSISNLQKLRYWIGIIALTLIILILRAYLSNYSVSLDHIGIYVVTLMSGFIFSTIVVSLLFRKNIY